MNQIILTSNQISVGILPDCGGSLSFLKYNDIDVLRPCSSHETEANNTALFVMLPYASFITNGQFSYYLGITRTVPKNSPVSRWPIHGDIWREKISVIEQTKDSVKLQYTHKKQTGFPYDYRAIIIYQLTQNDLKITLQLENMGALPMPYGMGIHPFFKCDKNTQIQYNSKNVWYRGDDPILGNPYPVPTVLDFSQKKQLPHDNIDMSADGFDSLATVFQKDYTLQMMTDDTFHHIILYKKRGKDWFCLEPVTHTPDAFNLASQGIIGTGIQSLGPKESVRHILSISLKGTK